jgi:DNA-binding NtrC family response regulator
MKVLPDDRLYLAVASLMGSHWTIDDILWTTEMIIIERALHLSNNNCTQAAKLLGILRSTLVEKRRRLGFPLQEKKKKKPKGV